MYNLTDIFTGYYAENKECVGRLMVSGLQPVADVYVDAFGVKVDPNCRPRVTA